MKKLFSLFSMLVLLSSNALPVFTYADSWDNELAIQILTEEVNNVWKHFTSENEDNLGLVQGNYGVNTFWNSEYTVTFNLNWWYWTEDWTTDNKYVQYNEWNQWILTNRRTPSKVDACTDWEKTNMKCMFDGWYLEEEWLTRRTWYVSENIEVYAKWLPFEDREVILNDWTVVILMDRNIWATTWNINDKGSYWYFFQRWNNYWFKFKWDNDEIFPNWELTINSATDNTISNNVSNYYYSMIKTSKWTDNHLNLWWWQKSINSDTLKQGPCPKWYHVPDYEEWRMVLNWIGSDRWLQISSILNLSFPWYTFSSNYLNSEWSAAVYLAANPNWSNMNWALYLYKNWGNELSFGSEPYYKDSVRCFKDFPIKDIVFHTNSWTEILTSYQTARNWTFEDQDLPIPSKENMDFQWWYTTEDFKEDSRVLTTYIYSTGNNSSIDLYAKRNCSYWYESEDNWETCVPYSVKFESNWGNFWNWNKYKISSDINIIEKNVIKYSHTSNIDDMWNQNWNYWSNLDTNKVITITWADELNISIKYWTYYDYNDYVTIWKWKHSDYLPSKDYSKSITWKLWWWNHNNAENIKTYVVNWESATFWFRSRYVYNYDGYDYYWYYATISWIEKIPYVTYPEHSFDNIQEPTRENSIFKWRYFDNDNFQHEFNESDVITWESMYVYAKWECESWFTLSDDGQSCNPNVWVLKPNDWKWNEAIISRYVTNNPFINNWYEFIWWNTESDWNWITYKSWDIINESWLVLFAQWKALEEKAQETTAENVVYTNTTTVTVWDEQSEEILSWSSTLSLVSKEIESNEVTKEEDITKVKDSEIKVTSDKSVEYEWWLEVYLEKTEDTWTEVKTGKVEWTAKFSSPVAVKIPIYSNAETAKVQVKHEWEEFGYKGLTINPINSCSNGEAVNDKYNGENISVKDANWEKYVLIYTCSASTFVAYTENVKPTTPSPAAWGGRTITSTKNENNISEQEHNSADTEKAELEETATKTMDTQTIKEQVMKVQWRSLTRWEIAIMTNILLDVYPQLTENRELNEVSEACESYADEQNFTKDEKKAITRLCKLSIMWIHADDNKPLDEFMVNEITKNDEFSKVINRSLSTYTEKDFSVVKDALKKLEWDEENVVFGTVYDVFMGIKNIFSK